VYPHGNATLPTSPVRSYVRGLGTEDPRVAAREQTLGLLQIEECEAQTVKGPRRGLADPVVDHEPSAARFDEWRREADLVRVPPTSSSSLEHQLVVAPVGEIRRKGHPYVGTGVRRRAVNQGEQAVDASRKERRILVVRLHDQAEALKCHEILGQREGHAGSSLSECRVRNDVLAEFFDECDSRIFDPPKFVGMLLRIRRQCGNSVDDPTVASVLGTGGAQMGLPSPVFDPAQ
jgi:hypothetical protein